MDIQRLRNITTGHLHTQMAHIYEDIETITGATGVMTHMLSRAADALRPYLQVVAPDVRLWDNRHDATHRGFVNVPPMDAVAQAAFLERYHALLNPLECKRVVCVDSVDELIALIQSLADQNVNEE